MAAKRILRTRLPDLWSRNPGQASCFKFLMCLTVKINIFSLDCSVGSVHIKNDISASVPGTSQAQYVNTAQINRPNLGRCSEMLENILFCSKERNLEDFPFCASSTTMHLLQKSQQLHDATQRFCERILTASVPQMRETNTEEPKASLITTQMDLTDLPASLVSSLVLTGTAQRLLPGMGTT